MSELKGVFAITATPFLPDGAVDVESIRTLVEFEIARGVDGLAILGIMGEAHKLTEAERQQVTEAFIAQVRGRVPVVVGTSAAATDVAIWLSRQAEAAGAAAVMVAPPPNLRNLDAVFEYYRRVASSVRVPVVVQDEPVFTGVLMPAEFLARLCREIPGCRYMKLEEAPTPLKVARTLALAGSSAAVFGGLGGVYFLEELERGATGTMTGFAYPEILVEIYRHFTQGNKEKAREVFYRYSPLLRYEGQAVIGLAIRKEILRRRGAIRHATVRHPGPALDAAHQEELALLLRSLGLE